MESLEARGVRLRQVTLEVSSPRAYCAKVVRRPCTWRVPRFSQCAGFHHFVGSKNQ